MSSADATHEPDVVEKNATPQNEQDRRPRVAVIGGGPAGLMAAEVLSAGGEVRVDLFDAMPSVGRKFLLAGVGGLNLSHAEPQPQFLARYGAQSVRLAPLLDDFGATQVREWAQQLGIETFVGSSGRVFPRAMKAAPLLRSWLRQLRARGVAIHVRQRWSGWRDDGALRFLGPAGEHFVEADATVFALGGGSWARLGSDGAWFDRLAQRDVQCAPLRPANCGFNSEWSDFFRQRFAGTPVKSVTITAPDSADTQPRRGEFVVTEHGVEGSLIYALSAGLRDTIERTGSATIHIDLSPDRSTERLLAELSKPRGANTQAKHLHARAGIDGVKAGLLREVLQPAEFNDVKLLIATIKALPLQLLAPRPLDEAISSAGGVSFTALDDNLMLTALPGHFCAGEMLDWEAPTGGYLLTACFATGRRAGLGVLAHLDKRPSAEE